MAVPARPVSGNVVDSAWGQVAHDTAVAMDIQAGAAPISGSGASAYTVAVTFPRPFAAAPVVTLGYQLHNGSYAVLSGPPTTTGCTIVVANRDGATSTIAAGFVGWIAYGPRA